MRDTASAAAARETEEVATPLPSADSQLTAGLSAEEAADLRPEGTPTRRRVSSWRGSPLGVLSANRRQPRSAKQKGSLSPRSKWGSMSAAEAIAAVFASGEKLSPLGPNDPI